jgi:hypothetical protein
MTRGPFKRADGLTVRHTENGKLWWCHICYGDDPHRGYQQRAESLGVVFDGWDAHKTTLTHQVNVTDAKRVEAIFPEDA